MELFVVNRYLESVPRDRISDEKALRKLHRLAKKRRKNEFAEQFEVPAIPNDGADETPDEHRKRKKKNKKKKKHKSDKRDGEFWAERNYDCPELMHNDVNNADRRNKKASSIIKRPNRRLKRIHKSANENGDCAALNGDEANKDVPPANDEPLENDDGTLGGYTFIEEAPSVKPPKVNRILPHWLAKPTVVPIDLGGDLTPVDSVPELSDHLSTRLLQSGITHFFPIQSNVIPWLLRSIRRNLIRQPDLCVSSPTGSGKTLAFVLPVVQALMAQMVRGVKALVVLPVRDLAHQVYKVFVAYCRGTHLKVGLAVGESNASIESETLVKDGKSLVDILVCTPGRLVHHIYRTVGFSLVDLRFIIIDEADRLMQDIKQDWVNVVDNFVNISRGITPNRSLIVNRMEELRRMPQKLLFSATLSQDPEKIHQVALFQPKLFSSVISEDDYKSFDDYLKDDAAAEFVGKNTTPKELSEKYIACDDLLKPLMVLHLIHNLGYRHLLCFTNSVNNCHRLSLLLSLYGGITVREFSANLPSDSRDKILRNFEKGLIDVIVCTDKMTRGMDMKDLDYVLSYDLPVHLKTYIHRVGRTARAGRPGTAITLVEHEKKSSFRKMMHNRIAAVEKMTVETELLEPMEEQYKSTLGLVRNKLIEENQINGNFKANK